MLLKTIKFIVLFLSSYSCFSSVSSSIREIEEKLELKIILDKDFKSTWTVLYDKANDSVELQAYLNLMRYEYSKYPPGYFRLIGISNLVLGRNLALVTQKRAAIPDPFKKALFLDVDSAFGNEYLSYVMHHDLNHCAEYAEWGDMYYHWKRWTRKNPCKFKYGKGGATAYEPGNRQVNWRELSHPRKGFVNLYATTGEEEDRSEIVSLLLTDSGYHQLRELSRRDRKLRKKTRLAIKFLDKVSHTNDNYWRRRRKNSQ